MNPLADELPRSAASCALVIFGATGDLTRRKLVPALSGLAHDGLLPTNFAVVGFARRKKTHDVFRGDLATAVAERNDQEIAAAFAGLAERVYYHCSNFEDAAGYESLRTRLDEIDAAHGTAGNRIFYLATPPDAYPTIVAQLAQHGLSTEREGRFARVIVEKPFGRDLASATELNTQVGTAFDESQVFRIDHYLGKETVQNILAMRFANRIFEPLWNEKYVDHVQITVAEDLGVGTRGAYFERSGIARDMIQNHLLQVLTLVAMEPPASMGADAVRDEKVKVLHAIRAFKPDQVPRATVRGQYEAGSLSGEDLVGYLDEDNVASGSTTETYAAVRLEVNNWRWAKTPFFLRAGKRMPRRVTEVAVHFRRPPHHLFGASAGELHRNVLLLRIQPDEGVSLRFGSKVPGPHMRLRDVRMDFDYGTSFGSHSDDAYERLLLDAMVGDSTLFARRDEVEEAWRIVDPIVAGWQLDVRGPVQYPAGTWGPPESDRLLKGGRRWRRP